MMLSFGTLPIPRLLPLSHWSDDTAYTKLSLAFSLFFPKLTNAGPPNLCPENIGLEMFFSAGTQNPPLLVEYTICDLLYQLVLFEHTTYTNNTAGHLWEP